MASTKTAMTAPTAMRIQNPGVPIRRFLMLGCWFTDVRTPEVEGRHKIPDALSLRKGFRGRRSARLALMAEIPPPLREDPIGAEAVLPLLLDLVERRSSVGGRSALRVPGTLPFDQRCAQADRGVGPLGDDSGHRRADWGPGAAGQDLGQRTRSGSDLLGAPPAVYGCRRRAIFWRWRPASPSPKYWRKSFGLQGQVTLKWPNDVLLDGKKVCGILLEASADAERILWAVAGIGLNVNSEPSRLLGVAASGASGRMAGPASARLPEGAPGADHTARPSSRGAPCPAHLLVDRSGRGEHASPASWPSGAGGTRWPGGRWKSSPAPTVRNGWPRARRRASETRGSCWSGARTGCCWRCSRAT